MTVRAAVLRLGAAALLVAVANLAPRSDRIARWRAEGDAAVTAGQLDLAIQQYAAVLCHVPDAPPIYERLVRLALEQREFEQARVYLYTLADQDGWTAARQRDLATILTAQGQDVPAAALQYALLDQAEQDPLALRDLAWQQISNLNWTQAETTLAHLLTLQPDHAEATLWLGLLLAPQESDLAAYYLGRVPADSAWFDPAETISKALRAYQLYTLTDAHTYLGIQLVGLGLWPFAEQTLQAALTANAINPTALGYLGFVRDQQGRDGLDDIEAALAMSPNDAQLYYFLGLHWRGLALHDDAYTAFMRAYELDETNPAYAAELGTTRWNERELEDAARWFARAVELAPIDPQWYVLQARFYADSGYLLSTTGFAKIEEAVQLVPHDPDAHASLGWAYYQLDELDLAYEALSQALTLDSAHPRSRYYFGVVLERQGSVEAAADSYWFVLETLGPDEGFGLLAARALERIGY